MSNQQVATQEVIANRPIDLFKAQLEKAAPTMSAMLPAHVTPEKFKAMVTTAIAYNARLLECTIPSLLRATLDLAELGLSTNPNMKEADILPVWNNKMRCNEAQARPRFTGLMKLARQSGEIKDIYSHEVYENDHFVFEYGLNKKLEHRPAMGERGELTYAYVVWETKDGIKGFEVVDKKTVEKSRSSSESYRAFKDGKLPAQFCVWEQHQGEMWRKTAIRRGAKYMPQSTESDAFAKALALEDRDNIVLESAPVPEDAAPSLPPPPKPTRESTKAAVEAMRKEQVEKEKQFRDATSETFADDGEVIEGEPASEPSPEPEIKTEQVDPAFTAEQLADFAKMFLMKLAKVSTENTLNAGLKDYEPELDALSASDPKKHKEIMDAVSTKRASLKRR